MRAPAAAADAGRTQTLQLAAQASAPRRDGVDDGTPHRLKRAAGSDVIPHVAGATVGALITGTFIALGLRYLGNMLRGGLNDAAKDLRGGLNDAAKELGGSVERAGSELASAVKGFRRVPLVAYAEQRLGAS